MSKLITKKREKSSTEVRMRTYQFYLNKYFNLFMNAYRFPELPREQSDYLLRKFWSLGTISAFIVEGTKPIEGVPTTQMSANDYPNGMIAFVPYAPLIFSITDWPSVVSLIPVRGATFIPTRPLKVGEECVIGFAQRNKKPVFDMVDYYIEKIVDTEMTIRTQLFSHKAPWLISTTPENEAKVKRLFERLENDELSLYIGVDEIEALKSLIGGNTYIIDKLYIYKQGLENELLTYLGIDNVGGIEKKEHLMVDEVNANNDIINDSSDCFLHPLQEFCEQVSKVLGFPLSVEATSSPVVAESNQEDEEDEKEEEQDE